MGNRESFFQKNGFNLMLGGLALCIVLMLVFILGGDDSDTSTETTVPDLADERPVEHPDTVSGENTHRRQEQLAGVIGTYIDNGNLELAEKTLNDVSRKYPEYAPLKVLRKRLNQAKDELNTREERFRIYIDSAARAEEDGLWGLAVVNYENALRIHRNKELENRLKKARIETCVSEAETFLKKEDYSSALMSVSKALAIEEREDLLEKSREITALIAQQEKNEHRAEQFETLKEEAEEHLLQKNYTEALSSFTKARSYVGSGDQARYIEARSMLCRKKIEDDKRSAAFEALLDEGDLLSRKGEHARALEVYKEALKLRPGDPRALKHYNRAAAEMLPSELTDSVGIKMVLIPTGIFRRGASGGKDTVPERDITVGRFYMDVHEITNLQYEQFDPYHKRSGFSPGDNMPVTNVTWEQAAAYCTWRGKRTGETYRLPTEAEWEKGASGGKRNLYSWGNTYDKGQGNTGLSHTKAQPVGSYAPNPYGLYDMSGNVWEWCLDWYDSRYYSSAPSRNPSGPEKGTMKCVRGGSFRFGSDSASVRARNAEKPDVPGDDIGFRTVRIPAGVPE